MSSAATTSALPLDSPDLPAGWFYAPLSELVDADRGIRYGIVQPGTHTSIGIPIVRVNDVRDGRINEGDALRVDADIEQKYHRTRLRGGEVLLTLVGTVGESAIVPARMANWNVARAIAVLPVNGEVSAEWVNLCLRSAPLQHYIRIWCTTTVQATFNLRDVARLPIPIPPKKVRERIADILGSLDDKIELNRRMNETLEALARRLFKSWFVDFDPVHAKAAVRRQHPTWPNDRVSREALPKLDAKIAELFPDEFEDSTLGPIPKGWKVGSVSDVAENPRRGIKPEEIGSDTPYIALEHMPRRSIALAEWTTADGVESGKFEFHRGDILFGKLRPYFHKVGVAPVDGVCSTDVLVIVPKGTGWLTFALGHVSSDEMIAHTSAASTGTKMPRTNWSDIARYNIAVPPMQLAAEYGRLTQDLFARLTVNIHEARELAQVRDRLLPKLLSGQRVT